MTETTLYQTILLELYAHTPRGALPNWVMDGLVEEGLAHRDEANGLVLNGPFRPFEIRKTTLRPIELRTADAAG
ncbi:hypothetical protein J2R99_002969 [Rhodopseudomonas julia]|uniref:Uncharacterized protein n=1 Tax=Rhodopseudomonas julia TaxID=200617 RepID=A0ABU0C997_9BRAD|nr:hypothetical protein [Rhodopseudomonas julia]MDQ0327100.1 hypothetical protein [Rhodopseudomonas julia]